ncbi:prepilin-type N-terminal cleavage/methylation domain-containing protein [Candidatus Gracilibacteria bacterium]|nr:prepilin-type N-terminal cleavage/methylation domain-containing protein [Candidatus Gracilibacteria bacterium]
MISNKGGFTLIELLVVITILFIIMTMTYLPYAHHQKKTLLKQGAREISQSLSEARNFALHGLDTGAGNLSIGLYFAPGTTQIEYYAYPLNETINEDSLNQDNLYKTKKLPKGIEVDSVGGSTDGYLFNFEAITASGAHMGESEIDIIISYQGSESPVLQKNISYYPKSSISDYK